MYERFTDRARIVMQLANKEAIRLNHEYIGTEHLLLGLLAEGSGIGATVLTNLQIDLEMVRTEIQRIIQSGPDMVIGGELPKTSRLQRAVEFAREESHSLGRNFIGTEHLLLGLLRETQGVAYQVLVNLGLEIDDLRNEVFSILSAKFTEGD